MQLPGSTSGESNSAGLQEAQEAVFMIRALGGSDTGAHGMNYEKQ